MIMNSECTEGRLNQCALSFAFVNVSSNYCTRTVAHVLLRTPRVGSPTKLWGYRTIIVLPAATSESAYLLSKDVEIGFPGSAHRTLCRTQPTWKLDNVLTAAWFQCPCGSSCLFKKLSTSSLSQLSRVLTRKINLVTREKSCVLPFASRGRTFQSNVL